ncbi:hypothetical protein [Paracoccus litorisediminis]|uniref:Uncharacterized protein n=1 Tax=Paracoccus litorisediminis TaxID=2006130 RepID=A0A844HLI6_9RHOB|nr:hypothetical protein [Paracoccus litorisediminis]MTH61133.1 hypothetical protein [Paracoccus litorisediminis]
MQTVEAMNDQKVIEALAMLSAADKAQGEAEVKAAPVAETTFDANALLAELSAIALPAEPEEAPEPIQVAETFEMPTASLDNLDSDVLAAIASAEVRAEAYQSQVSESDTALDGAALPVATKGTTKKPRAAATGTRAPRKERDVSVLPDETFVLYPGADPAQSKATVLAEKPAQIKVAEKWENLLTSLAAGAKPSCYIVTTMQLLNVKGTITSTDLVAAMKAEGAGDGTARSQAGQMMALFPLMGIGLRTGQTLALRQDSVVAQKLNQILAA